MPESPLDSLQNRLREIGERLEAALPKIDWEAISQRIRRLENEADTLAELGWTIPMSATPQEVADILTTASTGDVDAWFLRFYHSDDGTMFQHLKRGLLASHNLSRWKALLEQCFAAYDHKLYLVVVPSLLTVIDGAIAQLAGQFSRKTDAKRIAQQQFAQTKSGSMMRAVWRSVNGFIRTVFASHSFAEQEPPQLNRHWILKGRDASAWGEADCLRLFQALHTLSAAKAA